ncbi:MAG: DNA-3-methyladenine glycosylase I [Gammaproteobacteria bacterium]|nr:MAG: DNA-3-methyladenine glycosylase I [Gammaproteobacteria bacterium]
MTEANQKYLKTAEDGITRCWWGHEHLDYQHYHDHEWARPEANDHKLFEKICLEGFQSGLSWLTILRKRDGFREAFLDFDFDKVAQYDENKVEELLQNKGIVRHRGKIQATINNAKRAQEIVKEFGSLAAYIWQWEPKTKESHFGKDSNEYTLPSITETSIALSKDLKKRGWKFFGPTTAYAFMQAMGLVNDHVEGCHSLEKTTAERQNFTVPLS